MRLGHRQGGGRRRTGRALVAATVGCVAVLSGAPALMNPAGSEASAPTSTTSAPLTKAQAATTTTTAAPSTTTSAPAGEPAPPPTTTAPEAPPPEETTTTAPPEETTTTTAPPEPGPVQPPPAEPPPAPEAAAEAPPAPKPSGVSRGGGPDSAALLRLLQGAAARHLDLDGKVSELEANVARLEAEEQAAAAALQYARATQADTAGRVDGATADLRRAQAQVWEAIFRAPEGPPGTAASAARPPAVAGAPGQPGLGRSPLDRSAVAQLSAAGPPAPPAAPRGPDMASAVRAERELRGRVDALTAELADARARTSDALRAAATTWQALETERQALGALRRELSAALLDPSSFALGGALAPGVAPSARALSEIPADYLALYQDAATTCSGLSWTILAAIGSIESVHGRSQAPGVRSGANFAGARGPMQFLGPTWDAYGVDGDKDGRRDVYNASDAIFGAANYLCASGAGDPSRLPDAIWAYNHADWYVDDVLVRAFRYGVGGLEATAGDVGGLLASPNLTLSPRARADLANGVVDPRVVNLLAAVVTKHRISVSVFQTGHSQFVAGTDRVSNHFHGRAVDIYAVDGAPVSPSNDAALELSLAILTGAQALQPDEFGSPWPALSEFPGAFSDAGHQGHLHIGWRA